MAVLLLGYPNMLKKKKKNWGSGLIWKDDASESKDNMGRHYADQCVMSLH